MIPVGFLNGDRHTRLWYRRRRRLAGRLCGYAVVLSADLPPQRVCHNRHDDHGDTMTTLYCPKCGRRVARAEIAHEPHSSIAYHRICGADLEIRR
jgi:hypothetical protein